MLAAIDYTGCVKTYGGVGYAIGVGFNAAGRPTNQCTRIAKLRFLEVGCACGVCLASKVALLVRNRVISSVGRLKNQTGIGSQIGKMTSQMVAYKTELSQRYWEYQKIQFAVWQQFFDQPQAEGIRPPVFRRSEAWRNVIVKPDANQQESDSLLSLVPGFDRHKWFRSMNSSQALAQSILGNLAVHGLLSSLTDLQDDDGLALFDKAQVTPDSFAMEVKIDYLGEPRPTSLDGYIGGDYRVAIECKFTEAEVGTCSRPRLTPADSNYESDHCDGTYTQQRARKGRCSLTEAGILYWHYIPQLFQWDSGQDLMPCPLAANYQLVRNILAIGVSQNGEVTPTNGHVVLIYDDRNPAFQRGGAGFSSFMETQQALREPTMLRKCSWQRITQHMRDKGILSWLTEQLELKYGM